MIGLFFFNDTATTEIYTLSLHDALPIYRIIRQWKDSAGFVGKGDVLMFLSQGQAMIKINKISITEWDGKMPAPGGSERKTDEDRLRGADSDFSGK